MSDTTNEKEIKTILIQEKQEITLKDLKSEKRGITNIDRLTIKKDELAESIRITRSGLFINGDLIPFEMGSDPLVRPDAPFNGNYLNMGQARRLDDELVVAKMNAKNRKTPFHFYPNYDEVRFSSVIGSGALLVSPVNLEPTNGTAYQTNEFVHPEGLIIGNPDGKMQLVSPNKQNQVVDDNFRMFLTNDCFLNVQADGEGGVEISFDYSLEGLPDEKKELALVPDWFISDFKLAGKKSPVLPETGAYVSQIGTPEDRIYSTQYNGRDAVARYMQSRDFKETLIVTPERAVLNIVKKDQEDTPHEYVVQRLPKNSDGEVKVIVDGQEMHISKGQEVLSEINRRINEVKRIIIESERKKENASLRTNPKKKYSYKNGNLTQSIDF